MRDEQKRPARRSWLAAVAAATGGVVVPVPVQAQPTAAPVSATPLFIAHLSLGPHWDSTKPPQDQPGFREHSANLARLRREGRLVFGARYADKGLMILSVADMAAARAEFEADPMLSGGRFALDLQELRAFYRGCL